MKIENISIPARNNRFLDGRVFSPSATPGGVIVYSHGLFSSKDAYKINTMAEDIVEGGFILLTFSYAYTADYTTGNPLHITLDDTVADLHDACLFAAQEWSLPLHLFGSSMGGAASLWLATGTDLHLSSLTLLATPVDLRGLAMLLTGGKAAEELPGEGSLSAGEFSITNRSLKELAVVDIQSRLHRITTPLLIIHGGMDEVVDPKNAYLILEKAGGDKKLHIIEDGDHGLTAPHHLAIITSQLLSWLWQHS